MDLVGSKKSTQYRAIWSRRNTYRQDLHSHTQTIRTIKSHDFIDQSWLHQQAISQSPPQCPAVTLSNLCLQTLRQHQSQFCTGLPKSHFPAQPHSLPLISAWVVSKVSRAQMRKSWIFRWRCADLHDCRRALGAFYNRIVLTVREMWGFHERYKLDSWCLSGKHYALHFRIYGTSLEFRETCMCGLWGVHETDGTGSIPCVPVFHRVVWAFSCRIKLLLVSL